MQGDPAYYTVDSLSAFWPGLQVLAGDVENAIRSHMTCKLIHTSWKLVGVFIRHVEVWNIWKKFAGLPEGSYVAILVSSRLMYNLVWDMNFRVATSFQYPLRPEFIESTWYLYRVSAGWLIELFHEIIDNSL